MSKDYFEIKDKLGKTMAYITIQLENSPANFDHWDLKDEQNCCFLFLSAVDTVVDMVDMKKYSRAC